MSISGRIRDDAAAVRTGPFTAIRKLAASNASLAFIDQCAVSGQAFLILLLIGFFADLKEVGAFAVAMSVVAVALAIQDAAITRPYTVQIHRPIGSASAHLGASFRLSMGLAALLFFAALAVSFALLQMKTFADVQVVVALAALLPGIILREFGRRVSFAHERSDEAVKLDLPTVFAGLTGIIGLGYAGHLSAATALLVLAATNLGAGLCWVWAKGVGRRTGSGATRLVATKSWQMGRWLVVHQFAMQVQGYTTHWLTMFFLGAVATGVYAASLSIIAFANPVLYGLFNIMVPDSAKSFRTDGRYGVLQRALTQSLILGSVMLVFCFIIALFGSHIMAALYPSVVGTPHLLIILAVSTLIAAVGAPAAIALTSISKASHLAAMACITALINTLVVVVLLPSAGLLAAVYGTAAVEALGAAGRWILLYRAISIESPLAHQSVREAASQC